MRAKLAVSAMLLVAFLPHLACIEGDGVFTFRSADPNTRYWWAPGGALAPTDDATGSENEFIQRTVVEPDVIRRDGSWLYVLNQFRGLTIVDLDGNQVVSNLPTCGFPRDIYLQNNRAYILVANAQRYTIDGNTVRFTIGTRLYVADIADPAHASIISEFDLEGDLVDSRLVGDVLYAVGAAYDWQYGWVVSSEPGAANRTLTKTQTGATWVTSINVADPGNVHIADQISFDDTGTVIHATPEAIFVASPNWSSGNTAVTYIDISDPDGALAVRGSESVAGHVADRFKMDFWSGVLRVVSSSWADTRRTFVTTLDCSDPDALAVLAAFEFDRSRGEALFATRFDGPRAYVVTYFMVDPLFVLDLSDPANPQLSGVLEVPGWSTHIEPQGDRLIALGVDDTQGSRRVCVSIFDVSDPEQPALADRATFGSSWNWSSAYEDVKAFAVFEDVLVVPFSGWDDAYGAGFNRLQFVSYTPDDLTVRGFIDVGGTVLRTFQYQGLYYCVTTEQLVAIDASDLDAPVVTTQLILAENVSDFQELRPGVGAEVVTRMDDGVTLVRTVSLAKNVLGQVEVDIGYLVDSFVYGSSLVLVGQEWDPQPAYRVAVIDCTQAAAPQVSAVITVNVEPYGFWYGYDGPVILAEGTRTKMIMPWPISTPGTAFLAGDMLALRCWGGSYDDSIGNLQNPAQGLAIVDLARKEWTQTIGLGFDEVVSVNAQGAFLYVTYKVAAGYSLSGPLCAYFVTRLNPETGAAGPAANVPGIFVQYNPTTQILILRDDQWSRPYVAQTVLRTVLWDGTSEGVSAIDELTLPTGASQVLGRGSRLYVDVYDDGYRLYTAVQSQTGALTLGSGVLTTDQWGFLVDAHSTAAYLSIGDGAIARYNCAANTPQLTDLTPVMGAPLRLRFGSSHAYAALGYFGAVPLPL